MRRDSLSLSRPPKPNEDVSSDPEENLEDIHEELIAGSTSDDDGVPNLEDIHEELLSDDSDIANIEDIEEELLSCSDESAVSLADDDRNVSAGESAQEEHLAESGSDFDDAVSVHASDDGSSDSDDEGSTVDDIVAPPPSSDDEEHDDQLPDGAEAILHLIAADEENDGDNNIDENAEDPVNPLPDDPNGAMANINVAAIEQMDQAVLEALRGRLGIPAAGDQQQPPPPPVPQVPRQNILGVDKLSTLKLVDYKAFKREFRAAVLNNQWDLVTAKRQLFTHIIGEARVLTHGLAEGDNNVTFETLLTAIDAKIQTEQSSDEALAKFYESRQLDSEEPFEWLSRLRSYFIDAHPNVPNAEVETDRRLIQRFLSGLYLRHAADLAVASRPQNLTEALNAARSMIAHVNRMDTNKGKRALHQIGGADDEEAGPSAGAAHLNNVNGADKPPVCGWCGRTGHTEDVCNKKKRARLDAQAEHQGQRGRGGFRGGYRGGYRGRGGRGGYKKKNFVNNKQVAAALNAFAQNFKANGQQQPRQPQQQQQQQQPNPYATGNG